MTNKPISEVIAEIKLASELIERGYRQAWGCEDSDDCIHVGTFNEDGDLCPFIETSISDWSGNDEDNENLANYLVVANPVNVKRLIDHIAALEQQLSSGFTPEALAQEERAENAEQRIAELEQQNAELQFIVETADKVQKELADELGCAGDNESVLEAVGTLKQQLAAERARVVKLPKELMPECFVYSSVMPEFASNDSNEVVGYRCWIHGNTRLTSQEQAYADAKAICDAANSHWVIPVEGE